MSEVTEGIKAVKGLVEAVPIYNDALQPATKQLGKGLETITKTVHVALAPLSALVWGYEHLSSFLDYKLTEKLRGIPEERIITPSPLVAGPLLESLRYAGHEENLANMYANLLATSMDSESALVAHPGFVPILKSMSPDEAKIMKFFATSGAAPLIDVKGMILSKRKNNGFRILARNFSEIGTFSGCTNLDLVPTLLDNLIRLGLLEIVPGRYIINEGLYERLENSEKLVKIKEYIDSDVDLKFGVDKKKIELTDLGKQFCKACVIDKSLDI